MANIQDFFTENQPTWCPGCGLYAIRNILTQTLVELNIEPHNVVITYDIGCNGNGADKIRSYSFKSLHGRSIPPAIGIKYANHDLTVLSIIGDGGMFWEGAEHFLSSAQRNEDVKVFVCDNQIYGLTTGQTSPTTPMNTKTSSYPYGTVDKPLNPLAVAISCGATFVARSWVGNPSDMKETFKEAINHKGFAIIDILTQCVTWTKVDMTSYYKDMIYGISKEESVSKLSKTNLKYHDFTNKEAALKLALKEDKLPIGIFYNISENTIYDKYSILKKEPLVKQKINNDISDLLEEFK